MFVGDVKCSEATRQTVLRQHVIMFMRQERLPVFIAQLALVFIGLDSVFSCSRCRVYMVCRAVRVYPYLRADHGRCGSDKIRQTVQTRAAATGKALSPTVDSRVRLTISDEAEPERSR